MSSIIKTLIALAISGVGLAACQDDGCAWPFRTTHDVYIKVSNAQGEDLLNPDHPNAFLDDEINLFGLINGKRGKIFDLSGSRFELGYNQKGRRVIVINPPSDTAIIQWSDVDLDTVVHTIKNYRCSARTDSVWINNALKWVSSYSDTNLPPDSPDVNLVKEGRKTPPTSQ